MGADRPCKTRNARASAEPVQRSSSTGGAVRSSAAMSASRTSENSGSRLNPARRPPAFKYCRSSTGTPFGVRLDIGDGERHLPDIRRHTRHPAHLLTTREVSGQAVIARNRRLPHNVQAPMRLLSRCHSGVIWRSYLKDRIPHILSDTRVVIVRSVEVESIPREC